MSRIIKMFFREQFVALVDNYSIGAINVLQL